MTAENTKYYVLTFIIVQIYTARVTALFYTKLVNIKIIKRVASNHLFNFNNLSYYNKIIATIVPKKFIATVKAIRQKTLTLY